MPLKGTSNEYPQHLFSWTNKKTIDKIALLSGAIEIDLVQNDTLRCRSLLLYCTVMTVVQEQIDLLPYFIESVL